MKQFCPEKDLPGEGGKHVAAKVCRVWGRNFVTR